MRNPYEAAGLGPEWTVGALLVRIAESIGDLLDVPTFLVLGRALMLYAGREQHTRGSGEFTAEVARRGLHLRNWIVQEGFEEDIPLMIATMGQLIALLESREAQREAYG